MATRVTTWTEITAPAGTESLAADDGANKRITPNTLRNYIRQEVTTLTAAAIQEAINSVSSQGGGIVQLVSGIYILGATGIEVKSNVTLRGAGRDCTILRATAIVSVGFHAGAIATLGATNAGIENLQVDLKTNSIPTNGITFTGATSYTDSNTSQDCWVDRCTVNGYDQGTSPTGYHIWNRHAKGTRITNNIVDGDADGAAVYEPVSGQEGIEVFGGTDVLVSGNVVKRCGNAGLFLTLEGESNLVNERITFTNNHVESCRRGIYITAGLSAGGVNYFLDGCVISNNQVVDCYEAGITIYQGTAMVAPSDAVLVNLIISNNTVKIGPSVSGASDNRCVEFDKQVSSGTAKNFIFTGNTLVGGIANNGSIFELNRWNDVLISNNSFNCNSYAANYALFFLNASNIQFKGNVLKDINKSAMNINGCSNGVFDGNSFVNIQNIGGLHTIYLNGDSDYCKFTNNISEHSTGARFVNDNANSNNTYYLANTYINAHTFAQVSSNGGGNFGSVTIAGGSTSQATSNELCLPDSDVFVHVRQKSGPLENFSVTQIDGSFTVTRETANASPATYQYKII